MTEQVCYGLSPRALWWRGLEHTKSLTHRVRAHLPPEPDPLPASDAFNHSQVKQVDSNPIAA